MPKFSLTVFYSDSSVHFEPGFEAADQESALRAGLQAAQAAPSTHGPVTGVQVHPIPPEEPPLDPQLVAAYRDARNCLAAVPDSGARRQELAERAIRLADAVLAMTANGGVLRLDPR